MRRALRFTRWRQAVMAVVACASVVIALVSCGGNSEPPDGLGSSSSPTVLSTPSAEASSPPAAALGSGELIVYEQLVAGREDPDLFVVDPDGGQPHLLRAGAYPHWSGDGSQLAFTACLNPPDCTTGVALLDRVTGKVHGYPMADPDLFTGCAIWAPDGQTLACEGNSDDHTGNGVYTVRASDGQGLSRLTHSPSNDSPRAYSPDGGRLLFDRGPDEDPAHHALYVMPSEGGKAHRITPMGYSDDYASWTPDGRAVVFGVDGNLYRVHPDGTGLAKLAIQTSEGTPVPHAFDVSYSPDGTQIVFSTAGSEPGLFVAQADGSGARRLTTSPTEDHHANWGPAVKS